MYNISIVPKNYFITIIKVVIILLLCRETSTFSDMTHLGWFNSNGHRTSGCGGTPSWGSDGTYSTSGHDSYSDGTGHHITTSSYCCHSSISLSHYSGTISADRTDYCCSTGHSRITYSELPLAAIAGSLFHPRSGIVLTDQELPVGEEGSQQKLRLAMQNLHIQHKYCA